MDVKISVLAICVEVITYLLLHILHGRTFKMRPMIFLRQLILSFKQVSDEFN